MNHDLEVDVSGVRQCASALAGAAARVAGAAGETPPTVVAPRWASSDAATRAGDAAAQQLTRIGADIAATARQIVAAVVEYEAADDRAATRLRSTR